MARFVADNIDTFEASDSKLPEYDFNRLVDNWKPLSAIAGILLADLKQKFTDDRIFSKDLVELLAQMKERLWPKCVAENRSQTAGSHANCTHLKSFRAIFALALNIKSDLLWLEKLPFSKR